MSNTKTSGTAVTHRMQMLNTIFMKQISDLLGTGTVNPLLVDRGIEILDIQISYGFETIKIFWDCQNEDENYIAETADLLNASTNTLRYHLSNQHIISKSPIIQFIQDEKSANLREIDRKLKIADFGEDVEIKQTVAFLDNDISAPTEFINSKDLGTIEGSESIDLFIPVMRNNVFGLNQKVIMSKIKSSLKKTRRDKAERLAKAETVPNVNNVKLLSVAEIVNEKEEQQLFKKYLMQQQVDKKRKEKQLKKELIQILNAIKDEDDDVNYEDEDYTEDYDSSENDDYDYDDVYDLKLHESDESEESD